jgi:phosphatidyl-myo-inositol dimannoside synthase
VKVLIFSRDFPPDHGGVQISMERIARFHGEDAVVITRAFPNSREFDERQPYKIKRMPRLDWTHPHRGLNFLLRAASLFLRFIVSGIYLGDAIRDQKTDVVYCAYPLPNGLPMLAVRVLTSCPYVVYVHGTEFFRERHRGGPGLWGLRAVLWGALRIVVTGPFMADAVSEIADRRRIVVTPLGADSGALDPTTAPATEIDGTPLAGRRVILTVGRVEKRKGHDMLAQAMPEIVREFSEALWIVVGSGPELENVRASVNELGLADHVVFTGGLSYEALSGLYARADVFIMPNRRIGPDIEGFGIVFLEAATFGVPCIAGNSGGARNAIDPGRTGLLCDGESPAEIAAAALTLLRDPEKTKNMGEAGRVWVKKHTWRNYAETVAKAVEPLVD